MDKEAALHEAARRGLLPPKKQAAYDEAIRRGIIEQPPNWKTTVSQVARPVLEGIGMAAGGLIGAAAGVPMGGIGSPALAALGGAGGYAIASQGADVLDIALGVREPQTMQKEIVEAGTALKKGMQYELGGRLIPFGYVVSKTGGKWIFEKLSKTFGMKSLALSEQALKKEAGKILTASTSRGPVYAKNAKEAARIQEEIPGLRFTRGQTTGGATEIAEERALFRRLPRGAQASTEQIAKNDQAIRDYMAKNFPGESGIDEYISAIRQRETAIQSATGAAQKQVSGKAAELKIKTPTQAGRDIISTVTETKKVAKEVATRLYEDIPDVEVNIKGLVEASKGLTKTGAFEKPGGVHFTINKFLSIFGKKDAPEVMKFSQLRDLRSTVLDAIREESGALKPNLRKLGRLTRFEQEIESSITQLGDETQYGIETVSKFRRASEGWRQYKEIYEKGSIADALRPGARGEETRLAESEIAGIFWGGKPEAADSLVRAIGKDRAKEAIQGYANYDLLKKATNPVTGEIDQNRLARWLFQNKPMLQKFGISGSYKDIEAATSSAEQARSIQMAFEKSAASRILKADPDKAVAAAFSGETRNTASVARQLLAQVKGNPAAEAGLKKTVAEHILREAETTSKNIEGQAVVSPAFFSRQMKKYGPALDVLYADSPDKLKSLKTVQRAYEIMARNKVSPLGGGSDTAENFARMVAQIAGPTMTGRYAAINAMRTIATLFTKYESNQIDRFLLQGALDPEYAETLKIISTKGITPNIERRLTTQMTAVGLSQLLPPERSR